MENQRATRRWLGIIFFALTIVIALLWLEPPVVHAASITVNSLTDTTSSCATTGIGTCTLRDAITFANSTTAPDTINVSIPGTITLSSALAAITETLTINGNTGGTTISGNHSYPVLQVCATGGTGVCNFTSGPTVNLAGLTIANGYNFGSTGGLYMYDATLNITNTTFISNPGAINTYLGTLSVNNSTLTNNSAFQGGAIYSNQTPVTITQSTFTGNGASDKGGAVIADGASSLMVINSTFYSNTAAYGGALVNMGNSSTTLINDTLSDNRAITGTGGITSTSGTITLRNTIVTNSVGNNCGFALAGAISNGGNNIDSGSTCGFGSSNGSMSSANPLLGAFGNYGGATKLLPLSPGSPAINGVTFNAPNSCPSADQRGIFRPQAGICDIGAYEVVSGTLNFLPLILR